MEFGVVLPGSLGVFWVVLIVVVEGEREKQAKINRIISMGCIMHSHIRYTKHTLAETHT